ncbi:MAG TPA: PilZ domain-containing protein [Allosphingosinicella sp.]|uniref:PilZ domain-containing protein n=1 Tax=Allosphingosinicella sp. TaxID=2823234 RepID=UPI002ED7D41D
MLGDLIRRSLGGLKGRTDDIAFETTTFSLSTEVPRPTDRRVEERLRAVLPIARLVMDHGQDICRVRNISAGGLSAETSTSHPIGTRVRVEFNSNQHLPGEVVWTRETSCGIKFDKDVDLRELLANRPARGKGKTVRPPRLDITCSAELLVEGVLYRTEVQDISLGGIKVSISDWNCVNKDVVVTLESLRPIKGAIRWYKAGYAGIVFKRPLSFEELAEWMGKRVEVATLKAGAWTKAARF